MGIITCPVSIYNAGGHEMRRVQQRRALLSHDDDDKVEVVKFNKKGTVIRD